MAGYRRHPEIRRDQADQSATGEEALDLARHYDYDIILLDLKLPDMDGCDVIRRLRAGRIDTPVMVLSGSFKAEAKAQALQLGADDFLSKPFDRMEMLARVQAIVRRCRGHSEAVLRTGSSNSISVHVRSSPRPECCANRQGVCHPRAVDAAQRVGRD